MNREAGLEWERRWARWAAVAAVIGPLLFVVAQFILAGMLAAILKPKPRWGFSLREIFIILTLTAVGSAAIAAVARVVPRH